MPALELQLLQEHHHPRQAGLGEHELEFREPLEHPSQHQVAQATIEEQEAFVRSDGRGRRPGVGRLRWVDRDRVPVDGHLEFAAGSPKRIEVALVEVDQLGYVVRWDDDAGQPFLLGPANFGYRIFDIVQEDLGQAASASWRLGAELGQPAVVGLHARPNGADTPQGSEGAPAVTNPDG